ncbi:S-adenosyl-L-methionine-dependent tRNA 4-demethylwyosine synthase TYW1, partial [Leptonychotes weddellii]|uniref:tRNA 4-demethylwyosine synthase (AdoMet-dependent) n=1 Tax=Leptonychotes weddellii TaxID=9713 RepID=A0A7F8QG86_LEPWE
MDPSLDTWDFSSPLMSLWMNRFYVYLGFAFGISLWICFQIVIRKQLFIFKDKNSQKSVPKATGDLMTNGYIPLQKKEVFVSGVKIFYGSQTGTAKGFATSLAEAVTSLDLPVAVINLKEYDPDDHLVEEVGKNVDKWLWMLGAHRVVTRGEGDCDVAKSKHGSIEADFRAWKTKFLARLQTLQKGEKKPCDGNCKRGQCESSAVWSPCVQEEEPFESTSEEESGTEDHQNLNSVVDVEDLGKIMNYVKKEKREKEQQEEKSSLVRNTVKNEASERRAMITPALREALTKQGYQLIGSHSGVKLCRWTKSMLRGRGGCYKHTFYGIESHRCMETTPSLACANKCVFCWRERTCELEGRGRRRGRERIVSRLQTQHRAGCRALSHNPEIKSYKVLQSVLAFHNLNTFEEYRSDILSDVFSWNLKPVTQLYVSVDASTKDSLKQIDRPLFKDFWQRFLDSLKALAAKQQRTVYRLTLVKAWNVDELQAYAELVSLGNPDFIEVKGVTYCGESSASSLTMANVPWHEEVIHFVCDLVDLIPDYEIACEHEHSNCLLIAHKR